MKMQSVESSALKEAGYEDGEIGVLFHNGTIRFYPGTKVEFDEMVAAKSIGRHFLANIKPRGGRPPAAPQPDREMPPLPTEEPLARY